MQMDRHWCQVEISMPLSFKVNSKEIHHQQHQSLHSLFLTLVGPIWKSNCLCRVAYCVTLPHYLLGALMCLLSSPVHAFCLEMFNNRLLPMPEHH